MNDKNLSNLDELKGFIREELQPDAHNTRHYICPICNSGTHRNRTGAMSIYKDGIHVRCFACGFYGDIFDLVSKRDGIPIAEATRQLIAKYGSPSSSPAAHPCPVPAIQSPEKQDDVHGDFTEYINSCHEALWGSPAEKYLHKRGLSNESISAFRLGYDPECSTAPLYGDKALVIPYNSRSTYYAVRSLEGKKFGKAPRDKAGPEPIFNEDCLDSARVVFVVESQLCAVSVFQCGGQAVAVGGTGGWRNIASRRNLHCILILAFDNDDAGFRVQNELASALLEANTPFVACNIAGDFKDPNEALQYDPDGLKSRIRDAILVAEQHFVDPAIRDEYVAYMNTASVSVRERLEAPCRPPYLTGLPSLDKMLDGGLKSGLYMIGSNEMTGLSDLSLQIADHIASSGSHVLYFSLSYTAEELISNSISRISRLLASSEPSDTIRDSDSANLSNRLNVAKSGYFDSISNNIWFIDDVFLSLDDIIHRIEEHIRICNTCPVVFVDNLMFLSAGIPTAAYAEYIRCVRWFRHIADKFKLPVVCLSPFEPSSDPLAVSISSFGHGDICLLANSVLGLQFSGLDLLEGERPDAFESRLRRVKKTVSERLTNGQAVDMQLKLLHSSYGFCTNMRLSYDRTYHCFSEPVRSRKLTEQNHP